MASFGKIRFKWFGLVLSFMTIAMFVTFIGQDHVTLVAPPPDRLVIADDIDRDDAEAKLNDIMSLFRTEKGQLIWRLLTKIDALLNSTRPSFTLSMQVLTNDDEEMKRQQQQRQQQQQTMQRTAAPMPKPRGALNVTLKDFKQVITPSEKDILFDLAVKLSVMCHLLNVTYFMYGGTLLGSYRHHDLIPWDDDIDLIVDQRDRGKLYSSLVTLPDDYHVIEAGPRMKFFSRHSQRTSKYPWRWPYIDLSFFFQNSTHIWDSMDQRQYVYHKDIVFPLHDRPLGPIYLKSPKDAFANIRGTYKDVDCQTHFYSHKYERNIRKPRSIPCARLKDAVPFVHRSPSINGLRETLMLESKTIHSFIIEEPIYAVTKPYRLELV